MTLKLKDGTKWPDPTNEKLSDEIWRAIHNDSPFNKEDIVLMRRAAEAYQMLISSFMTLKECSGKIKMIRDAIKMKDYE